MDQDVPNDSTSHAVVFPRINSRKVLDFAALFKGSIFYLEPASVRWRLLCGSRVNLIESLDELLQNDLFKKIFYIPLEVEDLHKFTEMDNYHIEYVGPRSFLDIFQNKKRFQEFCESHNFPIASSEIIEGTKYFVKPVAGSGSKGVQVVDSIEAQKLSQCDDFVVQQQIISNNLPFGFSGFAINGVVTYSSFHERVVVGKGGLGSSLMAVSLIPCEFLKNSCCDLIRETGFTGFFMIELMRSVDGEWFIIEFNPRLWGSFSLNLKSIDVVENQFIFQIEANASAIFMLHGFFIEPIKMLRNFGNALKNYKVKISPAIRRRRFVFVK